MRTWNSLLAVSLLAGGAAACGDDEGGSPDASLIDASNIDAGIDAAPTATRMAYGVALEKLGGVNENVVRDNGGEFAVVVVRRPI